MFAEILAILSNYLEENKVKIKEASDEAFSNNGWCTGMLLRMRTAVGAETDWRGRTGMAEVYKEKLQIMVGTASNSS
jgi:hypothetical protein